MPVKLPTRTVAGVSEAKLRAALDAARPDDSALAAALAKKLSITQAKAEAALDAVRKAHDADRTGDRDDFYAAVAKTLGTDAAAVKKAFEAGQP